MIFRLAIFFEKEKQIIYFIDFIGNNDFIEMKFSPLPLINYCTRMVYQMYDSLCNISIKYMSMSHIILAQE